MVAALALCHLSLDAQQPAARPATDGPAFDAVSIKPHPEDAPFRNFLYQRPDGGFTVTNPASLLIARAYDLGPFADIVGLPEWARSDLYDVSATSSLSQATKADRLAMWRAMMAERFGLVAHLEKRMGLAYDLVLARTDGRLGPGLTRVAADCAAVYERESARLRAEEEAARAAGLPWPPLEFPHQDEPRRCALNEESRGPSHIVELSGDTTIAVLTRSLRPWDRRAVIDKTGLSGSYHVRLRYDQIASQRPPDAASPDDGLHLMVAIERQLGLKLRSSRVEQETLVVDRIERPTEN